MNREKKEINKRKSLKDFIFKFYGKENYSLNF